jgi:dolichol-phosphate mannosyltransferase
MIVLVVPTYNEAKNIEIFVKRIFELGIKEFQMVAIDDNSPDGTGKILDELSLSFPINVIHRSSRAGLGTAYKEAFRAVLRDFEEARLILQMDADFSHDPVDLPKLIEKGVSCDLVLGSRYISEGGVENWGMLRRVISRAGCTYSRLILSLPYKDLTGGFKCWKRETLANIDLENISSVGYNFQIEMTYKAHKNGAKICEIPIIFKERSQGTSKFHPGIIYESFLKVLSLRLRGGK